MQLVVFSEYIPVVFAVKEIDGHAVPFPAQCTYSQRRCRREIVLFTAVERV
jgi:hypothetical protein